MSFIHVLIWALSSLYQVALLAEKQIKFLWNQLFTLGSSMYRYWVFAVFVWVFVKCILGSITVPLYVLYSINTFNWVFTYLFAFGYPLFEKNKSSTNSNLTVSLFVITRTLTQVHVFARTEACAYAECFLCLIN